MKPVVVAENVYKKFSKRPNTHMNYGVGDLIAELTGKSRRTELRIDEFYAVNDVSLALNESETLALVGRNGSGKSTLLKMLAGLIKPDGGQIAITGNVQALINLGAGFNPRLSGRDNIFNAAAIRGLSRRETLAIFDEIVAFAELDEFIDSPIETYSSGMYARLGFATSIHLRPRILLIDEVLSVGDFAFQNKCFVKMHELKQSGVTIILVSHSHTQVVQLCDRALWLHKGKTQKFGDSKEIVKQYIEFLDEEEAARVRELNRLRGESQSRAPVARNASLYGAIYDDLDNIENLHVAFLVDGREVDSLHTHESLTIRYSFDLKAPVRDLNVSLSFWRKDGLHLTTISTLNGDLISDQRSGRVECEVEIHDLAFNPGNYVLVMPVHAGHSYLYRNIVKEFTIKGGRTLNWGLIDFNYTYRLPQTKRLYEHVSRDPHPARNAPADYEHVSINESVVPSPSEPNQTEFPPHTLGAELTPPGTALSAAARNEQQQTAPYQGMYGARLTAVRVADEPSDATVSEFCLKIESAGEQRSGINHTPSRFPLRKGARYLLQCRVFTPEPNRLFRLGVATRDGAVTWSANIETGAADFTPGAGAWIRYQGTLNFYAPDDPESQIWIVHWLPQLLTWYLDDLSLTEILSP